MYINTDEENRRKKKNKDNCNGTCFNWYHSTELDFLPPENLFFLAATTHWHIPNILNSRHIDFDRNGESAQRAHAPPQQSETISPKIIIISLTFCITLDSILHIGSFRFYCYFSSYRLKTFTMSLAKFEQRLNCRALFFFIFV